MTGIWSVHTSCVYLGGGGGGVLVSLLRQSQYTISRAIFIGTWDIVQCRPHPGTYNQLAALERWPNNWL